MFELAQLEQLLAFAKHKTLSKAAEEMHLSQPALTRSMQRLEEDIGVPLFERKKNKLSLNENGKLAVEFAEKIIFDVHTMPVRLREFDPIYLKCPIRNSLSKANAIPSVHSLSCPLCPALHLILSQTRLRSIALLFRYQIRRQILHSISGYTKTR